MGDLLSTFLLTRGEEGAGMSDRQVRDEILTLIVAGHETTATALTWTWYLLTQHPECERQLQAELARVGRACANRRRLAPAALHKDGD